VHFDFGANLRLLVERNRPDRLVSQDDLDFLREVLRSGALLEDKHFPLAARILRSFLKRSGADPRTTIVMNGLPRHVGQAAAVDPIVDIETLVHLRCSSEVILKRIQNDVGGDRSDRIDDDPESVRRKLALFVERTVPLLDHYRTQGAEIATIDVTATMTPSQMWARLNRRKSE
jgi:adenylate kinase family enzyme